MWNDEKRRRFQTLRQREHELTAHEQAELLALVQELEAVEAVYLTPATERLRKQRDAIEDQNRALQALVSRKEALLQRLRVVLNETQAERQAIERELATVLAGHDSPENHQE
jgi:hypothetical protein